MKNILIIIFKSKKKKTRYCCQNYRSCDVVAIQNVLKTKLLSKVIKKKIDFEGWKPSSFHNRECRFYELFFFWSKK